MKRHVTKMTLVKILSRHAQSASSSWAIPKVSSLAKNVANYMPFGDKIC